MHSLKKSLEAKHSSLFFFFFHQDLFPQSLLCAQQEELISGEADMDATQLRQSNLASSSWSSPP